MRPLFHACSVLVIATTAVSLAAQERKFHAQQGTSNVGVVLASSRVEIQPESGSSGASSWAFADLRCARYIKEAEPLPGGWGPLSLLTTGGKWLKNFFAKNTMDHFIDFVPKVGERVRLRFSDADVTRVNDQLKAGGVPQCEANVWLANHPELAQSQDTLAVTSHGE